MTTTTDLTFQALDAVRLERVNQTRQWGIQRNSWPEWMSILTEEVGEACQSANHAHWGGPGSLQSLSQLREELVQTAAVAVAIIEHIDTVTA